MDITVIGEDVVTALEGVNIEQATDIDQDQQQNYVSQV